MNTIFKPSLDHFVTVFFDDILIYSPSLEAHLIHLKSTFDILRIHQFFPKRSKCTFRETKIEYSGHIITGEGVSTDPVKIAVMVKWPSPTSVGIKRIFWAN